MAKLTPVDDAFAVFEFIQWAEAVADVGGVALVGPDQRRLIAAAATELRRFYEEAAERSRSARERGRMGGRKRTDTPVPSTERSRKSRAKKKAAKI